MPFTAPHEAAVVMVAKSELAAMPKRVSLPSMLPPACSTLAAWSTPSAAIFGLPACSATMIATTAATKIAVIAISSAQPFRLSPTTWPNARHRPAGIRKIASICSTLLQALGFSNGCAEFAFGRPPPLVPIILIASCDTIAPFGRDCVVAVFAICVGLPSALFGPASV